MSSERDSWLIDLLADVDPRRDGLCPPRLSDCPVLTDLMDLALGKVGGEKEQRLLAHVEDCTACLSRLRSFQKAAEGETAVSLALPLEELSAALSAFDLLESPDEDKANGGLEQLAQLSMEALPRELMGECQAGEELLISVAIEATVRKVWTTARIRRQPLPRDPSPLLWLIDLAKASLRQVRAASIVPPPSPEPAPVDTPPAPEAEHAEQKTVTRERHESPEAAASPARSPDKTECHEEATP